MFAADYLGLNRVLLSSALVSSSWDLGFSFGNVFLCFLLAFFIFLFFLCYRFAAGIFHDLHEEVMTTAARGHGLTIRVQQLEADFPSIEKAILSQTNHSRFTYNAGLHAYQKIFSF